MTFVLYQAGSWLPPRLCDEERIEQNGSMRGQLIGARLLNGVQPFPALLCRCGLDFGAAGDGGVLLGSLFRSSSSLSSTFSAVSFGLGVAQGFLELNVFDLELRVGAIDGNIGLGACPLAPSWPRIGPVESG